MWTYNYTYPDELYHHGIKGMKWGVRRYQNADGSLTDAGKKRYARDQSENSGRKRKLQTPDANRWVKEDIERTKKVTDEANNLNNTLQKNYKKVSSKNTSTNTDLSSMTDKELREKVNRALLEQQYMNTVGSKQSSQGNATVNNILENTGTVLTTASSVLAIALAIKQLTG